MPRSLYNPAPAPPSVPGAGSLGVNYTLHSEKTTCKWHQKITAPLGAGWDCRAGMESRDLCWEGHSPTRVCCSPLFQFKPNSSQARRRKARGSKELRRGAAEQQESRKSVWAGPEQSRVPHPPNPALRQHPQYVHQPHGDIYFIYIYTHIFIYIKQSIFMLCT